MQVLYGPLYKYKIALLSEPASVSHHNHTAVVVLKDTNVTSRANSQFSKTHFAMFHSALHL